MTDVDERIVAAAEADLQQLLSIEPSPEFAARVRSRVRERRHARRATWGWLGLALAVAAALILTVVVRVNRTAPEEGARVPAMVDITLPTSPATHDVPPVPTSDHAVAVRRVAVADAPRSETPEILIDPATSEAIRRMAISLRNAAPAPSAAEKLKIDMGEPSALRIAEPLDVPELVLKPADDIGGNQTR
jgi:hypothetical protein